jgi:hypothetical protein
MSRYPSFHAIYPKFLVLIKVQTAINLYVFFWVFPRRQPLKMDLTEGSETSAKLNLTQGKYPKENIQVSEHGENLKSSH